MAWCECRMPMAPLRDSSPEWPQDQLRLSRPCVHVEQVTGGRHARKGLRTLAALCARGPGHRGQTCSQTGVSAKEIRVRREADLCSIWPQIEQRLEAYDKDPSTRSGDGIELWSLVAAAAAAVTFVPVTQKVPLGLRDHRRCRQAGEKKIMLALRCRSEWIPNP